MPPSACGPSRSQTIEQRWEWIRHWGLSILVQWPLLVMVRQAERRERERSES